MPLASAFSTTDKLDLTDRRAVTTTTMSGSALLISQTAPHLHIGVDARLDRMVNLVLEYEHKCRCYKEYPAPKEDEA